MDSSAVSGTIVERMEGLTRLLINTPGLTVLDIGSNDGRIAYEFARRGARLIHGFELNADLVDFSNRLFTNYSDKTGASFKAVNLADATRINWTLEEGYDIVLYLGMYHHLVKQGDAIPLIEWLLQKANQYFAIRSPRIREVRSLIVDAGFDLWDGHDGVPGSDVGPLEIFHRKRKLTAKQ